MSVKRRLLTMLGVAVLLVSSSLISSSPAFARSYYRTHQHCYWSQPQRHCYSHRHSYRGSHRHMRYGKYYYYRGGSSGWNSR